MKTWIIGTIGAVLGFVISQGITYYTFKVNLETTKKIAQVQFIRDLHKQFYFENPLFRDIRMSTESCQKLYRSWGGKFNYEQINRYLGFFDGLGFYHREGILDLRIIDQMFGAYIIEAYEYNELRKYVELLQTNTKQKEALADFQALARKLEEIPERKEMIEVARRACYNTPRPAS